MTAHYETRAPVAMLMWRFSGPCPNCRQPIEVDLPALPAEQGKFLIDAEGLAAALATLTEAPSILYPERGAAAILAAIQEQAGGER